MCEMETNVNTHHNARNLAVKTLQASRVVWKVAVQSRFTFSRETLTVIEIITEGEDITFSSYAIPSLRLVREGGTQPTRRIEGPSDVHKLLSEFFKAEPAEVFVVLLLNAQNKVIGDAPVVITRGILNSSLVHPREVFRPAILAGAAAIIVAHNHPSGDSTPSAEDKVVTKQLVSAGKLLDIPVHDHLVVGDGNYTSFASLGLI